MLELLPQVLCALNALVAASDALESAIPKLEQMISSDENDLRAAVQEVEDVGNANAQLEIREIALVCAESPQHHLLCDSRQTYSIFCK